MKLIQAVASILAVSVLSVKVVPLAWANLQPQKVHTIAQVNSGVLETVPAITIGEIQAINREVEAVIDQGDVKGVLEFMAPFIISETITASVNGFESAHIEGIEQHREMLTNVFNEADTEENLNVQEISQKETIRITPDGQLATALISTVNEVTTGDELRLITTTDTIRFARLQGQIKVISYTTDSQITSHDLQE